MIKFKIGDNVKITIGKDKGREGKIEKILLKEGKVIIPGVNVYKKHVKGMGEQKGGIYEIPRPMAFGKFALICPNCKKETRVGFKIVGSDLPAGRQGKERFCKKCKKSIDTK